MEQANRIIKQKSKDLDLIIAGIADKVELTDDDIDVIQQLAIWYFTNKDNPVYHTDFAGEPSLQTVLESKKTIPVYRLS